jgi:hypothetical protein
LGAIELAVRQGHFDLSLELQAAFEPLSLRHSSSASLATLNECADRLLALATVAQKKLKQRDETTGFGRKSVGHKEENQESSIESGSGNYERYQEGEGHHEAVAAEVRQRDRHLIDAATPRRSRSISTCMFDVEVWKEACPAAVDAGLTLSTMTDVVDAGCFLSFGIGANRDALLEGTAKLGRSGSGLVSLYVYQLMIDAELAGRPMSNPGGRFRSILREVASGVRSLDHDISVLKRNRVGRAVIEQALSTRCRQAIGL